jgi:hypothetical protein
MTSGDATGICVGGLGRAWTSNEKTNITTPQARIEAIFDIDVFSLPFGRPVDRRLIPDACSVRVILFSSIYSERFDRRGVTPASKNRNSQGPCQPTKLRAPTKTPTDQRDKKVSLNLRLRVSISVYEISEATPKFRGRTHVSFSAPMGNDRE